jgi:2-succinyl-5-enolpyruvyl-6-hydroxy-3-cyclohexene-1-carboxylate synthase
MAPRSKPNIFPKIPLAQSIIQLCAAKGLQHVVISPGSRNAPLTIGFSNNPNFICYSVADERCAAFFAMGIAQQTRKPAIVVCTSGSALLNFYPAVAEAFYSQIPLVVISADRPPEMIDIGDGQTIRQENVLSLHTLFNANLLPEASRDNDELINEAINKALVKRGPVHINAPFEEPLYETVGRPSVDVTISAVAKFYKTISPDDIIAATNVWNSATRKLVLAGVCEPGTLESDTLRRLVSDPSVAVMTESTSNLHHKKILPHIDRIITPFDEKDFLKFQPEILLTFGGMVVSKRIKAFLRRYKPFHHWHVDPLRAYNTYGCLSHHFEVAPNEFFQQILPFTQPVPSPYQENFAAVSQQREARHRTFFRSAPFSDFKAIGTILPALPENSQLQVSNSASIRYVQLFDNKKEVEVFCNRGTSGIDGSTSTAVGASVGGDKRVTLLTGDIGFLYDSNGLWNRYVPADFRIIVINNGGGGIFRILPGHAENAVFHTFFETAHQLNASHLAAMYGFGYRNASDESTLKNALATFFDKSDKPQILEVFTPEKTNDKVLARYFRSLG